MVKRLTEYLLDIAEGSELAISLFVRHGPAAIEVLDALAVETPHDVCRRRVFVVARRELQRLIALP
jgi:hypothetical protein